MTDAAIVLQFFNAIRQDPADGASLSLLSHLSFFLSLSLSLSIYLSIYLSLSFSLSLSLSLSLSGQSSARPIGPTGSKCYFNSNSKIGDVLFFSLLSPCKTSRANVVCSLVSSTVEAMISAPSAFGFKQCDTCSIHAVLTRASSTPASSARYSCDYMWYVRHPMHSARSGKHHSDYLARIRQGLIPGEVE